MSKRIITISREFGSGGRTIGKMVADQMGIAFYDKELIEKIAEETGFSKKFIEEYGEHAPGTNVFSYSFLGRDAMGVSMQDKIWMMQRKLILDLAEKESCVIVGRCSDYTLRDNKNCLRVFFCAPMENRMKRVMDRLHLSEKDAKQKIQKEDKWRADNYRYYTGRIWGASANFDLTVNTALGEEYIEMCIREAMKR